jgi:hypothetical protein
MPMCYRIPDGYIAAYTFASFLDELFHGSSVHNSRVVSLIPVSAGIQSLQDTGAVPITGEVTSSSNAIHYAF